MKRKITEIATSSNLHNDEEDESLSEAHSIVVERPR